MKRKINDLRLVDKTGRTIFGRDVGQGEHMTAGCANELRFFINLPFLVSTLHPLILMRSYRHPFYPLDSYLLLYYP